MTNSPVDLDPTQSILFLGAGFTLGARSISRQPVPHGAALKEKFCSRAGLDPNSCTLSEAAEFCQNIPGFDLAQLLYNLFTVSAPTSDQIALLQHPWRRIYTTNYDDCVEACRRMNKFQVDTFSYQDEKPKKIPDGAIIHLHGYIRGAPQESLTNVLVLDETAYAKQHFIDSQWYREFIRDLDYCRTAFFVGYGLRDYKITSLLMQKPASAKKTYFITKRAVDKIFEVTSKPYGSILPIELEGFVKLCAELPAPDESTPKARVGTFKFMDPYLDNKSLLPPTAQEVRDLVVWGRFNYQRCLSTLPKAEYVVPRQGAVEEAKRLLSEGRCLLIHSRIGNGKSIFLHILAQSISQDHTCFWCRNAEMPRRAEMQSLAELRRLVIFFDSYDIGIELIPDISDKLPDAKFVISARTAIQDVRLYEVFEKLPAPVRRMSLNLFSQADRNDLEDLLDKAGLRMTELEAQLPKVKEFREAAVAIFGNKFVLDSLRAELERPLTRGSFRRVMIALHLIKFFGLEVHADLLAAVTRCDVYQELAEFRNVASDMFLLDDDVPYMRSPMLSEVLIRSFFGIDEVLDMVKSFVLVTAERRRYSRYDRVLFGSMMQFSNLRRITKDYVNSDSHLERFYDDLRRDIHINRNPLFWLQFAIAKTEHGKFDEAEEFIRTAYNRAAKEEGFLTFQIDTFHLKLILLMEAQARGVMADERFGELESKLLAVAAMIASDSNRFYAVEVMELIPPLIEKRAGDFNQSQRTILGNMLEQIARRLQVLDFEIQAVLGAENIRQSILKAKDRLLFLN